MNWYKKIKLANPVVEDEVDDLDYILVGHDGEMSKNILWFVDKFYRLHTISERELLKEVGDEKFTVHSFWPEYIKNEQNIIATGRYDEERHTATAGLESSRIQGSSPTYEAAMRKFEYAKKKITNLIDKAFNNPKIQLYN